jgi:hypothetical protein
MTKLVFFMLLSAAAAPSVRAGDTKDSLRDVMDICNQFIINDPDPGARLDYHNDCDNLRRPECRHWGPPSGACPVIRCFGC